MRRWNRIDIKLGGSIILLLLVVLLPLGFVIDQVFSGFYYNQVREEADKVSSRYAEILSADRNLMTLNMIEMSAYISQVSLFVVDGEGKMIMQSGLESQRDEITVSNEELYQLSIGKPVEKEYRKSSLNQQYLLYGKPIMDGNMFYRGVFVLSSLEGVNQSIQKIRSLLILSGIGAFFLALGFVFVLSRKLSAPLVQMEAATRKIAKGDLETRLTVATGDEIGSLATAINDLAIDLKKYRDSRSEFFANISHELRTPITYLEGYTQVVKEGLYQSDREREHYLDTIHQESKRLTRLINDLFELSKMEEGKYPLTYEWYDLNEILENIIRKYELLTKTKGLTLIMHCEDDLPLTYGDGHRVEQIIVNLLDNAIRYTMEGGITVNIQAMKDDMLEIIIEDSGKGIPEGDLEHIFDRFYRVEKSRARETGGTGLGLAIVKKLVDLQGGLIEVTSSVGKGTRFIVSLPIVSKKCEEGEK